MFVCCLAVSFPVLSRVSVAELTGICKPSHQLRHSVETGHLRASFIQRRGLATHKAANCTTRGMYALLLCTKLVLLILSVPHKNLSPETSGCPHN